MPTYEYECSRCSLVFEEFKPISAPKRKRCPKCRGKVERLISGGTAIVFKGSGFYVNDSSRSSSRSSSETSSDSLPSTEETIASQKKEVAKSEPTGKSKTTTKSGSTGSNSKSKS